jgi:hypothetical protein
VNGVVAVADVIAPMPLRAPQAAGRARIAFAVLIGLGFVLLPGVALADPHAAGVWLTQASSRWEVRAVLGVLPFGGIFLWWLMGAVRT